MLIKKIRTQAPAAIYVITQEDIRRSGARTIPDALRMAPGVTVTQAGSGDWTVTVRGGVNQFANKLLVLMDGRTIYSPLFSGVIWDQQDTLIEDIDRIEVIRGPGATLWGANAVNGVINIITKNAVDTQEGLVALSAGNQIQGIGSVRYGFKTDEDSYARIYAQQSQYHSQFTRSGDSANDNWKRSQAGFRSDSKLSDTRKLTLQGDAYSIDRDVNYDIPDVNSATGTSLASGRDSTGFNVLARYDDRHSQNSNTTLQAYIDNVDINTSFFNDKATTFDVDIQNVWTGWDRHELVWGGGYRLIVSENEPTSAQYSLSPQRRSDNLFSAFIQDRYALLPDELYLTMGTKLEHNEYTGIEIQPSSKLSWLIDDDQMMWTSVSRAVHTPSRFTDDGRLSYIVNPVGGLGANPLLIRSQPNRDLESEKMIAYEVGYRIQPDKRSSIDMAAFYHDYDDIFLDVLNTAGYTAGAFDILPVRTINGNKARSNGVELSGKVNLDSNWHVAATYSYINLVFDTKSSPTNIDWGRQPKNQFNIRSNYQFANGLEMNNSIYYIGRKAGIGISPIVRFDTRLAYEIRKGMELSLVGQNLLVSRQQEFTPFLYSRPAEIGRSIYGNITFKF
jgi:iron complex outermembrane receptor protein